MSAEQKGYFLDGLTADQPADMDCSRKTGNTISETRFWNSEDPFEDGVMSLGSQPISKRNVSLRTHMKGSSSYPDVPKSPSSLARHQSGDVESLIPLETQSSQGRSSSSSRDALHKENNILSHLSESSQKDRLLTTVLLNFTSVMERMDEQILPAVYSEIGAAFSATPLQLGYLTLSRALVQAFASPLGGIAGHVFNRIHVTSSGCFIWGLMTAGFAFCQSINQGIFFWAVNGIGLAMVIPNSQSCIADFYSANSRGLAFGALYVTSGLGAMFGSFYATNIGKETILSMPGWRFAFLSVAFVSLLIGALTLCLGKEPKDVVEKEGGSVTAKESIKLVAIPGHMLSVMKVPTFTTIVLQGIVGSIPWSGMTFLTLYFQLLGMSDFAASLQTGLLLGSTALGGLLGGWVGDYAGAKWPDRGRIAVCQFSVFTGIPFSVMITKVLPHDGEHSTVVMYACCMVFFGLLKSWAAPACNNPIFAEVVPAHLRTLVYSFDRCFEGAIAACAAPMVGVLAQKLFGFEGTAAVTGDRASDSAKANAIGNALLCFMAIPWSLCLVAYTGLYLTYPTDRAKALREYSRVPAEAPELLSER